MKKLLILILTFFTLSASSQDGLVRWFDTDTVDTFISTFNAPPGMHLEIGDTIFKHTIIAHTILSTSHYEIRSITGAIITGDLLVIKGDKYILYEYYVDEVIYDNGKRYHANRRPKPNFLNDYKKY